MTKPRGANDLSARGGRRYIPGTLVALISLMIVAAACSEGDDSTSTSNGTRDDSHSSEDFTDSTGGDKSQPSELRTPEPSEEVEPEPSPKPKPKPSESSPDPDRLALMLAAVANENGYGPADATFAEIINFMVCEPIENGDMTWEESVATDVTDGAEASKARAFNDFARTVYCPGMGYDVE